MMSNLERLVYMANQIARNFEALGQDHAATATADHMVHFWDPRMKGQIFEVLSHDENGLTPVAVHAVTILRDQGTVPPQTRATKFNAADEAGRADAG